jgi:hypothetical protein
MLNIIIQPTGNKDAEAHYENTVKNPVDITKIGQFVEKDVFTKLQSMYKNGKVPVWGVTPAKNKSNITQWKKIQKGDIALFAANKRFFASAVVTIKIHNKDLALELWGEDGNGQTWEYIYFLDEIREQNIGYDSLNKLVGFKNYDMRRFMVIDYHRGSDFIENFDLMSDVHSPVVSIGDYEKAVRAFDPNKPLDSKGTSYKRIEQGFLRDVLFGEKQYGICGICGDEYPVSFLVAAHIKKRSKCTHEEKLDFQNIVMPMCKFGCDDLFEKGYISVLEGKIIANNRKIISPALHNYLQRLKDTECLYWNENTSEYFKWHYNYHFNN